MVATGTRGTNSFHPSLLSSVIPLLSNWYHEEQADRGSELQMTGLRFDLVAWNGVGVAVASRSQEGNCQIGRGSIGSDATGALLSFSHLLIVNICEHLLAVRASDELECA